MTTSTSVDTAPATWRSLVGAALPLYLSMATNLVGSVIVIAALGRHATASLAAFTLTAAIAAPIHAAVGGALRGSVPFLAPHRDDPDALAPILKDVRWLVVALGLVGAGIIASTPVLAAAAGVSTSVRAHLGPISLLMAAAMLVTVLGGGANTALVALGRSRQVLWATLPGVVLNVSLTPTLVLGLGPFPELGIVGAGITSVLVAGLVVAIAVARLHHAVHRDEKAGVRGYVLFMLWPGRPRFSMIREIAGVGGPMSATLLIKFGVLAVLATAAARISADAAAAHGVLHSLVGLLMIAAPAVGQILIGDVARASATIGAPLVRRLARVGLAVVGVYTAIVGTALYVWSDSIIGLFTADPVVADVVGSVLPIMMTVAVIDAAQAILGCCLAGLKRATVTMLIFSVTYGLLAIAAVPMASTAGIAGLWVAFAATTVLTLGGQAAAFWRYSS
jgi:multidrug resistance protein, MATE family